MNRDDKAHELHDIADQVARLKPDRHEPETFHMDKHELANRLRRMADRLANDR